MGYKKPRPKIVSVNVIDVLNKGINERDVIQKGLVLEKLKNHEIYPYLVDGFTQITDMSIKNKLTNSDMIKTMDYYLERIRDNFIEHNQNGL